MGVIYNETATLQPDSLKLSWQDYNVQVPYAASTVPGYWYGDGLWQDPVTIPGGYHTLSIAGLGAKYAPAPRKWGQPAPDPYASDAAAVALFQKDQNDYTLQIGPDGFIQKYSTESLTTTQIPITSTGGTRLLTSKEVEGFKIVLSVPGLYKINKQTGYEATEVAVNIYYRPFTTNTSAPWTVLRQNYTISGNQRAEILKTVGTGTAKLPLVKYEILVVRVTEDHTGNMSYADDIYVKEIVEIVFGNIGYNHTALLGLKIRATDQLSGQVPTVTSLVKGIKVQVPSNLEAAYQYRYDDNLGGTYDSAGQIAGAYYTGWTDGKLSTTKVWTDNPVWCLYDLLTNTRYGLGQYYKISENKRGLMLANFYLMGKHCDEPVEYIDEEGNLKKRPRFALNIVIDQSKTAAEWVGQIAAVMRAVVYYSEGLFWIDIDRKKNISQIFNMSNITDYSQSGIPFRGMPNSYEVQWINPAINYEIDSFKLEARELQLDPTLEERKKALQLIGVTNFDQAKAVAQYALLSGKHKDKIVSFKTGTDGLRSSVSDIIGIQHDVPKWGFGGVITEYDKDTGIATIEPPIVPDEGAEYTLAIDAGLGGEPFYFPLGTRSEPLSSINIGVGLELSETPNLKAIMGVATNKIPTFKIVSIKRDSDEKVEITAILHDDALFDSCDDTAGLTTYTTRDYSLLTNPQRVSVQGVQASTKLYQDSVGVWRTGVEVFYDVPKNSTFWRGAQLHYGKVGAGVYTSMADVNTGGYFFLSSMLDGEYQIIITSIYAAGKQTINDALNDSDKHPWTTVVVNSYVPNDAFLAGVSGLSIENMANDGTFYGKDCVIVWKKPVVVNVDLDAGGEAAGAATTNDSWFAHYLVEVFVPVTINDGGSGEVFYTPGELRRTTKVYDEKYVYTYEQNYQDSIAGDGDADRRFFLSVTAVDKLGRRSKAVSVLCHNPAPPKI